MIFNEIFFSAKCLSSDLQITLTLQFLKFYQRENACHIFFIIWYSSQIHQKNYLLC